MESRSLQLLEFPKILSALSDFAVSVPGKAACLGLFPFPEFELASRMGACLHQAMVWSAESGFSLVEFPDLAGVFDYLEIDSNFLDQDGLYALRQVLDQVRALRDSLGEYENREFDLLFEYLADGPMPQSTISAIIRCLDPDGRLKDQASPGLMAVREEIRRVHRTCTKKVKDYIIGENASQVLQDEFLTISSDRYVLSVKSNFKGRIPGIVHDFSQTGETCYVEPMFLVQLNNSLQEYRREEREEERKVLKYLTSIIRQELDAIRSAYQGLVRADVLLAKCRLGRLYEGVAAELSRDRSVNLVQARHPLLLMANPQVQALDISMDDGHLALVVSGGNAGGKTVCLKTLGLIALMAMSAIPVPVREGSGLPFWENVFVVMGDEQSLEDNLSTFTAQTNYLGRVWDRVDENTLFILDEFGAGTDPTQGAALAQAVIDALVEKGCTVLSATHFPALKAYALASEKVRAASVLFDSKTKKPLYRLAYDQVGASIALDVARDNGMPKDIIEKAEQYLLLDGSDTSSVLDRLNDLAVQREHELDGIQARKDRLKDKEAKLKVKYESERKNLVREVRAMTQEIMDQWRKDKSTRKKALKEMAELKKKLVPEEVEEKKGSVGWDEISIGSQVKSLSFGKSGRVLEKDERKQKLKLDLSGLVMWVDAADVIFSDSPVKSASGPADVKTGMSYTERLDIRGLRADECVSALEKSLDKAILKGATTLDVIHGKGSGVLRKQVHEFLRDFPAVASYALADEESGGDGKTVVTLA